MTTGERFLIIGGSNKCGTTSLFRYLGAHPDVRLSTTKEARFFYRNQHLDAAEVLQDYRKLFSAPGDSQSVCVEASPTYLHGAEAVATNIHRTLPAANLLFLLRDPAKRLVSYYKSKFRQLDSHVGEIDFAGFVRIGLAACTKNRRSLDARESAFRQELTMAKYVDFLPAFIDVFGCQQVGIYFFEDLIDDSRKFVYSVCDFVGLDANAYASYEFTIENKTRYHRSAHIRKFATRFNERFERSLNHLPLARKALRKIYDLANAKPSTEIFVDPDAYNDVVEYYREPNRQLRDLLTSTYPGLALPYWLE